MAEEQKHKGKKRKVLTDDPNFVQEIQNPRPKPSSAYSVRYKEKTKKDDEYRNGRLRQVWVELMKNGQISSTFLNMIKQKVEDMLKYLKECSSGKVIPFLTIISGKMQNCERNRFYRWSNLTCIKLYCIKLYCIKLYCIKLY